MKILQICAKPLLPPFDGGKLAMMNMAEGLASEGVELVQLMIETPGHPFPATIPDNYPYPVHRVFMDTRKKPWDALLNLFESESYHLSRFRQVAFREMLVDLLQKESFDVIQAESPYVLGYLEDIRKNSKAHIVLRAHNVEHLIWERVAKSSKNRALSFYLRIQSKRLKREELAITNAVDGLVVMSGDDLRVFREMGVQTPSCIIGIGTHLKPPVELSDQTQSRRIFHLGAMNWFPNREGVEWFLKEVWPIVKQAVPGISLHLAGHGMPAEIRGIKDSDIIVETTTDAPSYMLANGVMIVPLLSGSGIRVKIIEGLKLGKVIVTTKIGVEGIGVKDGQEILIAGDAQGFAEKIRQCFQEPELTRRISENARNFAAEHFDTAQLAKQLLRFYQSLPTG